MKVTSWKLDALKARILARLAEGHQIFVLRLSADSSKTEILDCLTRKTDNGFGEPKSSFRQQKRHLKI